MISRLDGKLINTPADTQVCMYAADEHTSWSAGHQLIRKYVAEPDRRDLQRCWSHIMSSHIWASPHIPAAIIWSTITCDLWSQVWGRVSRGHWDEEATMLCSSSRRALFSSTTSGGAGQNSRGQDRGCRRDSTRTIALRHHRYWRVAP